MIALTIPDIRKEDIQLAVDVLKSGMLVQGEYVQRFEASLAEYVGVEHAVAVSSGTAALHLALTALGIGTGDAVLVPAFSFVATANAVRLSGAVPVFVDISQDDYNIDAGLLEKVILEYQGSEALRAIMPVHEFGCPANMNAICRLAKEHDLLVIEDAACALGARVMGQHLGTFGACGCFSFHPRKSITTGEGGVLTTNDASLAAQLRLLRSHGLSRVNGHIDCLVTGYNYRMTDFQAALGINQLLRIDENLAKRKVLVNRYYEALADHPELIFPTRRRGHVWQSLMLLLQSGDLSECIQSAFRKGIQIGPGAQCIPCTTAYGVKQGFPGASQCEKQGFVVPLYAGLEPEGVDAVVAFFRNRL